MTEMCYPCPRTPVTHVPSLYSLKPGAQHKNLQAERRGSSRVERCLTSA